MNRRRSIGRHGGFTLVELVTVLVIVAVLGAYLVPKLDISGSSVAAEATGLARELRHAQALAMAEGRTLVFQPAGSGYAVTDSGGTTVTDPATQQPFQVALDNGVSLSGGAVRFDSLGRPVSAGGRLLTGSTTLALSGGSQTDTVAVSPVTGFVSVTY